MHHDIHGIHAVPGGDVIRALRAVHHCLTLPDEAAVHPRPGQQDALRDLHVLLQGLLTQGWIRGFGAVHWNMPRPSPEAFHGDVGIVPGGVKDEAPHATSTPAKGGAHLEAIHLSGDARHPSSRLKSLLARQAHDVSHGQRLQPGAEREPKIQRLPRTKINPALPQPLDTRGATDRSGAALPGQSCNAGAASPNAFQGLERHDPARRTLGSGILLSRSLGSAFLSAYKRRHCIDTLQVLGAAARQGGLPVLAGLYAADKLLTSKFPKFPPHETGRAHLEVRKAPQVVRARHLLARPVEQEAFVEDGELPARVGKLCGEGVLVMQEVLVEARVEGGELCSHSDAVGLVALLPSDVVSLRHASQPALRVRGTVASREALLVEGRSLSAQAEFPEVLARHSDVLSEERGGVGLPRTEASFVVVLGGQLEGRDDEESPGACSTSSKQAFRSLR
mmetsp:Transcript_43553/g.94836  ORF Transcript_43553/g.94836 Transcript_43553/m.94836 type:complete len:449 (-) Transcript_43553:130-1476(-)